MIEIAKDLKNIRNQSRLSLPADDTYLYRLGGGVALYGFASINSFMTEIICHIDKNQSRIKLLDETSGGVIRVFRKTLESIKSSNSFLAIHTEMQTVADLFEQLNFERTDFVHAYPITNTEGDQILYRRKDIAGKYFEVDDDFWIDLLVAYKALVMVYIRSGQ